VIHRRLLGRPTFGRWEIDALFDTAARKGFYGVVDALINSREYNESFGEDTVPFERFITPGDLSVRRTPTFKRAKPAVHAVMTANHVNPKLLTNSCQRRQLRTSGLNPVSGLSQDASIEGVTVT
jgi:hypothetical protein